MAAYDANERLYRLTKMRYIRIPLTLELLKLLVRSTTGRERLQAIANNLAPPAFTLHAAGRLSAQLLKWAATEAILPDSLSDLADVLLASMASYWPRPACAHALVRAAVDEMSLLPGPCDAIKKACITFVRPEHNATLTRQEG